MNEPRGLSPEARNERKFEVEKLKHSNGFSYLVYFPTEDEAAQAIVDFWNNRVGSESVVRGIQSGMLDPKNPGHTIASGDRTRINAVHSTEQAKHPGMNFRAWFNGNEQGISVKGENALRRLGFIEEE